MDYYELKNNQTQYDDLDDKRIVKARYIHAENPEDAGNPLIEALPPMRTPEGIKDAGDKMLFNYDATKIPKMSDYERMRQVGLLTELRFPLPFHWELANRHHTAILGSYRSRELRPVGGDGIPYTMEDTEEFATARSVGSSLKPTNSGVALTGFSGCGKSSAEELVLSHYPQTIIHDNENGRFVQIVWLVVSCMPNSNFSAMFQGFGAEVDKALNNSEPVFERQLRTARSLGEKLAKVCEIVEKFSIGLIVFDEIQLIDFNTVKENSIESLLTLANKTKVAIAVVGTEDAEKKMFKVLRTARRIGPPVHADLYCDDRDYFEQLVCELMEYQWFDETISVTQDISDAFYDVTHGIVERLISVYSCVCYDYLSHPDRPVVDGDYIRMIDEMYFPGMQLILEDADGAEERISQIKTDGEAKAQALIDKARQSETMDAAVEDADAEAVKRVTLRHVRNAIVSLYPEYTDVLIKDAFNHVIKLKKAEGKSESEITRMVIDKLNAKPRNRTKKSEPALTNEQMRDMLNIDGEDK